MKNPAYLLALQSVDGLGPVRLKLLLENFKDPKIVWNLSDAELKKINLPGNVIKNLHDARQKIDPEKYLLQLEKDGICWVSIYDQKYPKLLLQIDSAPVVLYYKGDLSVLSKPAIAVVGSRKMSSYGKLVTESLVEKLAQAGLVIVSGLARGVDSVAHRSAIRSKGKTVAVLGGGLKHIYPSENISLAREIEQNGLVLSEFAPNETAYLGNFPARNRIISALSLGVLVTEADLDSGSLITARIALEQGKEVFAVPGQINSDLSRGPISLIKNGAVCVSQAEDILEVLGVSLPQVSHADVKLGKTEQSILDLLSSESKHLDELSRELGLPVSQVSASILSLEIAGLVSNIGGSVYAKR